MIRVRIQNVVEGVIKRFTAFGRAGETLTDREYMQHYGFTSRPLPGAEGVVEQQGNHYIMVATDDRRYRIPIEAGEVCIYTDEGDFAHFKHGNELHVQTGKLIATASVSASVTSPEVTVTASTSITLDTPIVTMTGDLQVDGDITADGRILDDGGAKSMDGMRATYNSHTHPDPQGEATGAPSQGM